LAKKGAEPTELSGGDGAARHWMKKIIHVAPSVAPVIKSFLLQDEFLVLVFSEAVLVLSEAVLVLSEAVLVLSEAVLVLSEAVLVLSEAVLVLSEAVLVPAKRYSYSAKRYLYQRSGTRTQRSGTCTQRSGTCTQRRGTCTQRRGTCTQRSGTGIQRSGTRIRKDANVRANHRPRAIDSTSHRLRCCPLSDLASKGVKDILFGMEQIVFRQFTMAQPAPIAGVNRFRC